MLEVDVIADVTLFEEVCEKQKFSIIFVYFEASGINSKRRNQFDILSVNSLCSLSLNHICLTKMPTSKKNFF